MTLLSLILGYIIGYFITFLILVKYGKKLGYGDYDEPKTYVNYDDYSSNVKAWTAFSLIWVIFVPINLLHFGYHLLIKFGKIIVNKFG